jgi:hypothetical protein
MFVITVLAVGVYLIQAVHFLGTIEMLSVVSLPDVGSTILTTFGVGQGAYLAKKAVGKVGEG